MSIFKIQGGSDLSTVCKRGWAHEWLVTCLGNTIYTRSRSAISIPGYSGYKISFHKSEIPSINASSKKVSLSFHTFSVVSESFRYSVCLSKLNLRIFLPKMLGLKSINVN